ncbi:uncharacterized protein DEA37_0007742 [Paragonimus westermani]|uniref:RRM domain-containing protein n=1 Tax=Paragonimus westermani TaxID=34504 RepID=A0A5J4NRK4_9TREM|nr:uncharacterized protein DEA37_0007742 [Paragonimus westermani]
MTFGKQTFVNTAVLQVAKWDVQKVILWPFLTKNSLCPKYVRRFGIVRISLSKSPTPFTTKYFPQFFSECKIIKDMHTQKPKGYGFVAYKSKQVTSKADSLLLYAKRPLLFLVSDHRPLNYMEVFNASSASNTTIYVGGITTGLSGKYTKFNLRAFYEWIHNTLQSSEKESVELAQTDYVAVMNNQDTFSASSRQDTVLSEDLQHYPETLLLKAFQEFGEIKEIRIFKEKGFSFISPYYPKFDLNAAILSSSGQLPGQLPCDISNSILSETLSIPLHGLPALHSGVVPIKPLADRSFYSTYPIMASLAPCQLANNLPLSMENMNMTLGLSAENTLASAMQLASLPQSYGLPMHNQTVMSISLSLADLANAGPYGCGILQQENIPRFPLVSNMNGVSSLC